MSSLFWYVLIGIAITFSIGFGLGALWSSHMGSVFLLYREEDARPVKPIRHVSDDPNDYWSGNWDGDIR